MNTLETSVLPTPDAARLEIGTLVDLLETERARIARELHDSVGQKVALVRRQRVELLNGAIAIDTRKSAGTRVCVRIPFR
jgi:signal transduction histidine kinase